MAFEVNKYNKEINSQCAELLVGPTYSIKLSNWESIVTKRIEKSTFDPNKYTSCLKGVNCNETLTVLHKSRAHQILTSKTVDNRGPTVYNYACTTAVLQLAVVVLTIYKTSWKPFPLTTRYM